MSALGYLLPLILLLVPSLAQRLDECRTPYSETGVCTPIRECSSIWRIVTNAPRPVSQETLDFLRRSACGSPEERRVCCRLQDTSSSSDDRDVVNFGPVTTTTNTGDSSSDLQSHPNLRLLDLRNCGPVSSERIAHGNETLLFEFPWMALLGYEDSSGFDWKCGGSLINSRYVLTAAHCVSNLRRGSRLTTVRLGEYDISKTEDCMVIDNEEQCTPPVQDIGVARITVHPSFNKPRWANDIALVRLAQEADVSRYYVAPICLPVTPALQSLKLRKLTVTGWGTTEGQHKSDRLLKINIPYVERGSCEQALRVQLGDGQFCAGGEGMADSCGGDSGGPIQSPENLGGTKYVQFGLVSFGLQGCGNRQAQPGVYTNVRRFTKWILDNIQA